ncbi:MAG: hypothetical protein AB7H43_02955 [Acidimicrobiia bacterium]
MHEHVAADLELNRHHVVRTIVGALVVLNVLNAINIVLIDRGHWLMMAVERNPFTWFESALFAMTAGLAWLVGRVERSGTWNLVAAVLLLLSIDEVATIHEHLGFIPGTPDIGSRTWIGAGLVLVGLVAARLLPWVLGLPRQLRVAFLLSGTTFVTGAIGFEWLAGSWLESHGDDRVFFVISSLEEDFEVLGILLLARQLLVHLAARGTVLGLRVTAGSPATGAHPEVPPVSA